MRPRERLLPLEQREHVAAGAGLGRIVGADVAREPGKRERLVARSAHQHAANREDEKRCKALEQDAIAEPFGARWGAEV